MNFLSVSFPQDDYFFATITTDRYSVAWNIAI